MRAAAAASTIWIRLICMPGPVRCCRLPDRYNGRLRDPFGGVRHVWRAPHSGTIDAMTLPPDFDEPALGGLQRVDDALDRGQARIFRALWFMVPSGSVARDLQFQQLLASRFLTDIALQALLYGALIASARSEGNVIDAALLGIAYLLPGVVLGMFGGVVADALPKRVALAGAYLMMGVLSLAIPISLGTEFRSLLLILFAVRALHQISQPSEASAVPLVASSEELASATSFLSFVSSTRRGGGKGAAGAADRARLRGQPGDRGGPGCSSCSPPPASSPFGPPRRGRRRTTPPRSSTLEIIRWLLGQRAQLWMLLLAAAGEHDQRDPRRARADLRARRAGGAARQRALRLRPRGAGAAGGAGAGADRDPGAARAGGGGAGIRRGRGRDERARLHRSAA